MAIWARMSISNTPKLYASMADMLDCERDQLVYELLPEELAIGEEATK